MSLENIEIVRRNIEAFNRGDLDAVFASVDPEGVIVDPPDLPDAKVYRGPDGARESLARFLEFFDEVRIDDLTEVIESGDVVFVGFRFSGRGKGSGVEITQDRWDVITFADGSIVRWEIWFDRAQALGAAGLAD